MAESFQKRARQRRKEQKKREKKVRKQERVEDGPVEVGEMTPEDWVLDAESIDGVPREDEDDDDRDSGGR